LSKSGDDVNNANWWQFLRHRPATYRTIAPLNRVLVVARVSGSLEFTFIDKGIIFHDKIVILASDKYYFFSLMKSVFHFLWAWKYCTTLGDYLTYTPNKIFDTFPFPSGLEPNNKNPSNPNMVKLDALGEQLDTLRKAIMIRLDVGLTKLYNLYHTKNLDIQVVMSAANCDETNAVWAVENIHNLRNLQKEIDETVLAAYGWEELRLEHGFYEMEFLPENDRVRYTVSGDARREILQRLLALNHERHKEEFDAGLVDEKGRPLKKKTKKGKNSYNADFVHDSGFLFDVSERGDLF
jgi:hypothetical protein